MSEQKPIVKICTDSHCAAKGSEAIFEQARAELHSEAEVRRSAHCLDHCEDGPNAVDNGRYLSHLTEGTVVQRIREELAQPSLRSDGAGTRSLDELDTVLDEVTQL